MTFGDLKAGDCFFYNGWEYEKISGNLADRVVNGKVIDTVEIPAEAVIYFPS